MITALKPISEALQALESAWGAASAPEEMSRGDLIAVNDAAARLRRCAEAVQAQLAAVIARESRPEMGSDSLAKQQGYRTPAHLIAAATGSSPGEASRLMKIGEATAPRATLTGEKAPAKRPHLQRALHAGQIGAVAAAAIVALLDRIAPRVPLERIDEAERLLVEHAPGLSTDQLGKLIVRTEAWLDPDGVEPREEDHRAQRSVTTYQRDGMVFIDARLDAASGAPVVASLQGYVSRQFQARQDAVDAGGIDGDHRTVPQMQADALAWLAEHALGCDAETAPLGGAQVVVRVTLEDLQSGTGTATIDGIDQPVSITEARRLAASGSVIPWVCGGKGEILDLGRARRLFSRPQKLILAERDGGCAMCGLPPGMAKAHHIRWWDRDQGPSDLDNGVLLCTSCHHRIHDNGWDIEIEGVGVNARVWFIPPPAVDRARTPRLGGRARFDLAA